MTQSHLPGCDMCGDNAGPRSLHARCHLTAPLKAELDGDVLTLRYYVLECGRPVARLRVAEVLSPVEGGEPS